MTRPATPQDLELAKEVLGEYCTQEDELAGAEFVADYRVKIESEARQAALRDAVKVVQSFREYAQKSPAPEDGGFKDPYKLIDQADRIVAALRLELAP